MQHSVSVTVNGVKLRALLGRLALSRRSAVALLAVAVAVSGVGLARLHTVSEAVGGEHGEVESMLARAYVADAIHDVIVARKLKYRDPALAVKETA